MIMDDNSHLFCSLKQFSMLTLVLLLCMIPAFSHDTSSPSSFFRIYHFFDHKNENDNLLGEIIISKKTQNTGRSLTSSDALTIQNDIVIGGFKAGENSNIIASFVPQNKALTTEFWKKLEDSCHHDGIYQISIPVGKYSDENTDFPTHNLDPLVYTLNVQTFTKSCLLLHSNFTISIWLNFNILGHLVSVNIKTPAVSYNNLITLNHEKNLSASHIQSPKSDEILETDAQQKSTLNYPNSAINVRVFVQQMVQAPVPDTQTWLQRMELEKAEKTKSAYGDKNSFIAKYWIYIVIFFVFILLSGAMNPDGGSR